VNERVDGGLNVTYFRLKALCGRWLLEADDYGILSKKFGYNYVLAVQDTA
jgi:hypothetical protein